MSAPMFALAAEMITAPLLVRQGKRLRQGIPRLPEPDGLRHGECGQGALIRIMVAGDSAAAGVGVDNQSKALSGQLANLLAADHSVQWQLHAKTGYRTRQVIDMLNDVPEQKLDVVVMSVGLNDTLARTGGGAFLRQQGTLLDLIAQRFSPALVLLTAIPPLGDFPGIPQPLRWVMRSRRDWLDAQLARLCRECPECVHLNVPGPLQQADMASDGFHPGPRIYRAWAEAAAAQVRDHFPGKRSA